jgi:hypothetical protein
VVCGVKLKLSEQLAPADQAKSAAASGASAGGEVRAQGQGKRTREQLVADVLNADRLGTVLAGVLILSMAKLNDGGCERLISNAAPEP